MHNRDINKVIFDLGIYYSTYTLSLASYNFLHSKTRSIGKLMNDLFIQCDLNIEVPLKFSSDTDAFVYLTKQNVLQDEIFNEIIRRYSIEKKDIFLGASLLSGVILMLDSGKNDLGHIIDSLKAFSKNNPKILPRRVLNKCLEKGDIKPFEQHLIKLPTFDFHKFWKIVIGIIALLGGILTIIKLAEYFGFIE